MASAVTTQKIGSTSAIKTYFHVPGGTSATVCNDNGGSAVWLDMSQYESFGVEVMNAVSGSSSGPTLVDIVGADDSSNSGDKQSVVFIRTFSKSPQLNLTTPAPTSF